MIKKNKLLFIDGISRSGKSSLCQTIVALKNVEHVDLNFNFEYLFAGVVKKKINLSFAKDYFDSSFSRYTYDRILGRNLNLIKSDFTSIYNYYDPKIYINRIKNNSIFKRYHYKKTTSQKKLNKDHVMNHLKSNNIYFPIQSHFLFENISVLKKLGLNYKMIRLNRHPVDNIYSYLKRGWGKIHKSNHEYNYKNATYPAIKENIFIPWYLDITKKNYLKLNEVERSIFAIVSNLQKIKKNKSIRNVYIVNFDNLCTTPKKEFEKLCRFLKVKKQKNLNKFLLRANLPRKINFKERENKLKFLFKNTNNLDLIRGLENQIKIFENN